MKKIYRFMRLYWLLIILSILWIPTVSAENAEPVVISATVTSSAVELSPDTISENTPFIIHIINQSGSPVELENSDTSVEVYANVDKTFKVGLAAGSYVFFDDFNTHIKPAALTVKVASALNNASKTPSAQMIAGPVNVAPSLNTSEILFIVWRESVEALLVVGIVCAWLSQLKTNRRSGFLFLGLGVVCGLLCAILLSYMLITARHILSPDAGMLFQIGVTMIAALMIVYMVKWMRRNGRTLKTNMQQSLEKNSAISFRNISIFTVVTVAIAREASEAAIFIYALGFNNPNSFSAKMLVIFATGILLAAGTIFLLQLGNKIFSWRFFFKLTEVLLLLLGGGLVLSCIDQLILSGYLSPLQSKFWDTSFLIGDHSFSAPFLASFTGYRATPSLMSIMGYGVYWFIVYLVLKQKKLNAYTAKPQIS